MLILDVVIVIVSSVLVIVGPLLGLSPKVKRMLYGVAGVFIVTCGCEVAEMTLSVSWGVSLCLAAMYLAVVFALAKVVEKRP